MLSIGSRISRVATNRGHVRPKAATKVTSPGVTPLGRHPKVIFSRGDIAERFRVDVLEKSGRWRWPMGQRSARRRTLGRQPRQRRGVGAPRGGARGPRGRGPQPPDFEELLRRGQDRFRRVLPGGFGTGTGIAIVVLGILVIWLASGFYRVLPDEVG